MFFVGSSSCWSIDYMFVIHYYTTFIINCYALILCSIHMIWIAPIHFNSFHQHFKTVYTFIYSRPDYHQFKNVQFFTRYQFIHSTAVYASAYAYVIWNVNNFMLFQNKYLKHIYCYYYAFSWMHAESEWSKGILQQQQTNKSSVVEEKQNK